MRNLGWVGGLCAVRQHGALLEKTSDAGQHHPVGQREEALNDPANLTLRFRKGVSMKTNPLRSLALLPALLATILMAVTAPFCSGQSEHVTSENTSDGGSIDKVRDEQGRLVREIRYDKGGRKVAWNEYWDKDRGKEEKWRYDNDKLAWHYVHYYGPHKHLAKPIPVTETLTETYAEDGKTLSLKQEITHQGNETVTTTTTTAYDEKGNPKEQSQTRGSWSSVKKWERDETGIIRKEETTETDGSFVKKTLLESTPDKGWVRSEGTPDGGWSAPVPVEGGKPVERGKMVDKKDAKTDEGEREADEVIKDVQKALEKTSPQPGQKQDKKDTQKEDPPKSNNNSSLPGANTTSTIGAPVPKLDFYAGYSYFHHFVGNQSSSNNQSSSGNGLNFNGGSGAVTFNFTPVFGLVGDFGPYHNNTSGLSTTTFTYLFGPQFTYRGNEHVTPFFHVLVGGAHQSESFSSGSNTSSSSSSANAFAFAPGGGLDVNVSPHIAIRVAQVDYLLTKFKDDEDNRQNNVRVSAGIVFRWGK